MASAAVDITDGQDAAVFFVFTDDHFSILTDFAEISR
jgi:hypothetical protein